MSNVGCPTESQFPNDWPTPSIGELAVRVGSGVTPLGGEESYSTTGIPLIRSQNVTDAGLNLEDVAYIDELTHNSMRPSAIVPFDVLLNITGASIGRCCYVPSALQTANVNQHVCTIRLHDVNGLDAAFLRSVLTSHIGQRQIFRFQAGGNREGLNFQQLRSIRVPWPSPSQRSKIAAILTTVDNLIEQTELLIEKYRRVKAGMMADLLTRGIDHNGQLRPPQPEAPHLYKQSNLGWIPKEWDASRLGKKLTAVNGYLQTGPFGTTLHAHEYVLHGVPVIMPQDIEQGKVVTDQIARVPEIKAYSMSRHRVQPNDVVFSRRGDLTRAADVTPRESGWLCGTGCFLLRVPESAMSAAWLQYTYRSPFLQRQVDANAVGSTMPSLNNGVMQRLDIGFPPVREQHEIANRIGAIESENSIQCQLLEKFRVTKAGLMQDLLTGRVRVNPQPSDSLQG